VEDMEEPWPGEESFYDLAGGVGGSTTSPSSVGGSSNLFSWDRRGALQIAPSPFFFSLFIIILTPFCVRIYRIRPNVTG
jgi:hypothetical protein